MSTRTPATAPRPSSGTVTTCSACRCTPIRPTEYPYFAGHHDEIGTGAGEGFNLNLPLAPRSGWDTHGPALDTALRRVAEHGTEVLVVALGVDTAIEDGVLAFGEDDFRRLGSTLADTGLPTVLVQEGGYDLDVLGRNVVAVLDGFAQHA